MEDDPPLRTGPGLRGRLPGLDNASRIVLWGGGVHDWLDPLPAIRAVHTLQAEIPDLRLVFMGTQPPRPGMPRSAMLARAGPWPPS